MPGSPLNLHATDVAYNGITLAWDAPLSDGGAPIKHYIIVVKEITKKKFKKIATVDSSTLSYTVTSGIEENHSYLFRVYAENEVGFCSIKLLSLLLFRAILTCKMLNDYF